MPTQPTQVQCRRRHIRITIAAEVALVWRGEPSGKRRAVGITRNLTAHGAYIVSSDSPPPVHADISFSMHMPPMRPQGCSWAVSGKGTVLRVEPVHDGLHGIAVWSRRLILRPESQARRNQTAPTAAGLAVPVLGQPFSSRVQNWGEGIRNAKQQ